MSGAPQLATQPLNQSALHRRPWLSWWLRERATPYIFLAPTLSALSVVFFYPMIETVRMSFYAGGLGDRLGTFVGLDQYYKVLSGSYFSNIAVTSVVYSAGTVVFVWGIGLATALLLHRRFPARPLARALIILPWAIPHVSAALIWGWMFDYEFGVLNYALQRLSLVNENVDFLTACPEALASLTGVSVWKLFPIATVMFLASLQTIPQEYYDAATVDGAGPAQSFWHVTLPGIRTVSIYLTLLIIIWSFGRAFTVIFLLTGGGPAGCTETIVIRSYLEAFKFFHPGTAAALGVIVLMLSIVFSALYLALLYRKEAS